MSYNCIELIVFSFRRAGLVEFSISTASFENCVSSSDIHADFNPFFGCFQSSHIFKFQSDLFTHFHFGTEFGFRIVSYSKL